MAETIAKANHRETEETERLGFDARRTDRRFTSRFGVTPSVRPPFLRFSVCEFVRTAKASLHVVVPRREGPPLRVVALRYLHVERRAAAALTLDPHLAA